jgi:hypothetical protein
MAARRGAVPAPALSRLRTLCLALPEVAEEAAWAGTRWVVRKKNFAHAVAIEDGWPPAYAEASGLHDGCVLTFRFDPAHDVMRWSRPPFFRPPWFANIAGVELTGATDWNELETLVIDSYRVLAPGKLAHRAR